jgi:hypothetical protein
MTNCVDDEFMVLQVRNREKHVQRNKKKKVNKVVKIINKHKCIFSAGWFHLHRTPPRAI